MISKKAQTSMTMNIGLMVVRLIFMVLIAVSIVFLVYKFIALSVDVKTPEGNILVNRLISSPGCLAYTDQKLGRSYPGIVDLAKFSSKNLDSCAYFGESNDYAAANLTLTILGTGKKTSISYNEVGYKLLYPKAGIEGTGGATMFEEERYVLLMDGPTLKRAILNVKLVLPND